MARAIIEKARTFANMPLQNKWLFSEAMLISAYVKFALVFLPFRKVAGWLGQAGISNPGSEEVSDHAIIRNVKSAIRQCDRYAPWPTECYTKAITGKLMLKRRNIPSTIYFGFHKNEMGEREGHAWLLSSGKIVTGFCDLSKYQVHTCFS